MENVQLFIANWI